MGHSGGTSPDRRGHLWGRSKRDVHPSRFLLPRCYPRSNVQLNYDCSNETIAVSSYKSLHLDMHEVPRRMESLQPSVDASTALSKTGILTSL